MERPDYSGQTIGDRYRILRLIGDGGMGAVYLGQHMLIGKKVAIKFLHTEFAADQELVTRFYREARASVAIAHPNIIDVMDMGVFSNNEPYIVMEYLEGESLSALLKRKAPLDLPSACAILEPALLALTAAHEKGIVHRDLKPENIFLVHQPGALPTVKLIDFGISKFLRQADASKLTRTGVFLGTPSYMSPEQIRGDRDVDQRTDLYALGVILYEMLTAAQPFKGERATALLASVITDAPIPPSAAFAGFPKEAESLVLQLLSKNPDDRPPTAAALLDRLKALESFTRRYDNFSHYITGITVRTVAAGYLGSHVEKPDHEQTASEILAELAKKETASDVSHAARSERSTRFRKWLGVGVMALLVVALIIFGMLNWIQWKGGPDRSLSADGVPSPSQQIAEIEVLGIPDGAIIHFGNTAVLTNPFKVVVQKNPVELKVSVAGYVDFTAWIVPDRDQTVKATLIPNPNTGTINTTKGPGITQW